MKKQFLHQGDVQLIETTLPKSAKSITKRPLALGEKSGHQHLVTGDYELFEDETGNIYVSAGNAGCVLQHIHESVLKQNTVNSKEILPIADHKVIELQPKTVYKVGIHQKYEPFKKVFEKVID